MRQHKNVIIIASLALFGVLGASAILFSSDNISGKTESLFIKALPGSCIGTLPINAYMIDKEESIGLTVNTAKTYSPIDTSIKCQYVCNKGFTGGNCLPIPIKAQEIDTCIFNGSFDKQSCKVLYSNANVISNYSCSGVGSCKISVSGVKGTKLGWKSTCGENENNIPTTTIDNQNETVSFSCVDLGLYEAFLDGNSVNKIESITKVKALADCKTIASNNPSSKVVCNWRGGELFRQEAKLPPKAQEIVTCVFNGSFDIQSCKVINSNANIISNYSCSGVGSCKISVSGVKGTKLGWKSTCGENENIIPTTIIDNRNETVSFSCVDLGMYEAFLDGNSVNKIESITKVKALADCKTIASNNPSSQVICNWKGGELFRQEAKLPPKAQEIDTCIFSGSFDTQSCKALYGTAELISTYSCSGVGSCKISVSGVKGTKLSWKSTCGENENTILTTTIDNQDETVSFRCVDLGLYEAFLDGNSVNKIESITKVKALADCKTIASNNPSSQVICNWKGGELFRQEAKFPPKAQEIDTCVFSGSFDTQSCKVIYGSGELISMYSCSGVGSCKISVSGVKGTKLGWKSTCGENENIIPTTIIDNQDETVSFSCVDLGLYEAFLDGNSVNKIESTTKVKALADCKTIASNNPSSQVVCNWKGGELFRQEAKVDYCSTTVNGVTYKLNPCNIEATMESGRGNKDFSFNILPSDKQGLYQFSIYGYGEGFPTYGIIGDSSGGAKGDIQINESFNDKYLKVGDYNGYLKIKVSNLFSNNGLEKELRLNIKLKVTEPIIWFTGTGETTGTGGFTGAEIIQ